MRERQKGRPLRIWCFWRDLQGLGRHLSEKAFFRGGCRQAQRLGKSEDFPLPLLLLKLELDHGLRPRPTEQGLSLSDGARFVPTIGEILSLESEVPSHARRPKIWRLFINRLPELRRDRRSSQERLRSAGLSGPEPDKVRSGNH